MSIETSVQKPNEFLLVHKMADLSFAQAHRRELTSKCFLAIKKIFVDDFQKLFLTFNNCSEKEKQQNKVSVSMFFHCLFITIHPLYFFLQLIKIKLKIRII